MHVYPLQQGRRRAREFAHARMQLRCNLQKANVSDINSPLDMCHQSSVLFDVGSYGQLNFVSREALAFCGEEALRWDSCPPTSPSATLYRHGIYGPGPGLVNYT